MANTDWLVEREARKVVTRTLDGTNPPASYARLSAGQKAEYKEKFLQALYNDQSLHKFCHDKRVGIAVVLVKQCRSMLSRITDEAKRAGANKTLKHDPSSLPSEALIQFVAALLDFKKRLDGLPPAVKVTKPQKKAQEEAQEGIDENLTEMARAVITESKLTHLDYARKLGSRILRYKAEVAKGTPASHKRAGYLWRELRNSLAGWLAGTPNAVKAIEHYQGASSDSRLSAFAKQGYAPVKGGKSWVHSQWTQTIPKPLVEWQSEWTLYIPKNDGEDPITSAPNGEYTPAEVAAWLYETNLGRVYLESFLGAYAQESQNAAAFSILMPYPVEEGSSQPPPLFALDSSESLGNGTAPSEGGLNASPQVPSFDLLVRGTDYFTGPLTQRRERLQAQFDSFTNEQKRLGEAEAPQDPRLGIKFPAAQAALNFLEKKTENEAASWEVVGQKTSARDPWIPNNVLSAFASYMCQFSWNGAWSEFFLHPSGVGVGNADWWNGSGGNNISFASPSSPSRAAARLALQEAGLERGGWWEVPTNLYDPCTSSAKAFYSGGSYAFPRLKDLSTPTRYAPWRLEVVRLGPKGAYAYRTFDWFPHDLDGTESIGDIVDLYKLPHESEEEFLASLMAENNSADDFISGATKTFVGALGVPRVIPMVFLKSNGTPGNAAPGVSITEDKESGYRSVTVKPKPNTWGRKTNVHGMVPDEQIAKLETGISPISKLYLFYLNNDYSQFGLGKGVANILYKAPLLYRTLTGKSWPSGTSRSPKGTEEEHDSKGELNPDYLAPGEFARAKREYKDWVEAYQTLYTKEWAGSQYVNVDKEVAQTEQEWAASSSEGYEGSINPTLIPNIEPYAGSAKSRVFIDPPESRWDSPTAKPYIIGQGFVSRVTRSMQKGSRLSSIERAMGIPEPGVSLVNIGKEVKRSLQQQRITLFEKLVTNAFLTWLGEAGTTGPIRREYQEAITKAYNQAWSGYFTPESVGEGEGILTSKGGAAFAPKNKYNVRALYGPRKDLSHLNPATMLPYSTAVSDEVSRWNPRAIARKGREKSLYPYQSDAVLRLVDKNGGLLAFDVGVGKTITSLAAVGMLKQQGKATRPVFLVPKSIKLKWWKDMKENYPDWRVAVFGMKIGYPSLAKDLDADASQKWKQTAKTLAGGGKPGDEEKKAALLFVTGRATLGEAISAAWGKLDPKIVKRVGKGNLDNRAAMAPRWVKDTSADAILKLQRFRDGYYDCLLLDETDFKSIAIDRAQAGSHLLKGSATFGYIFAKAFGSTKGYLGKPTKYALERLMVVVSYLGIQSRVIKSVPYYGAKTVTRPIKSADYALYTTICKIYLLKTNEGSTALWDYVPLVQGDAFPYEKSCRAYVNAAIPGLAGSDLGGELFTALGDLFFERNLNPPRTAVDEEVFDYYVDILNADKDIQGQPAGAYLVDKKSGKRVEVPEEQRGALDNAIKATVNARTGVAPTSYPPYLEYWPNLMREGLGRHPDGTLVQGAQQIVPISWDMSLPTGRQGVSPIRMAAIGVNAEWGFVEPVIVQTAPDMAQEVADVINVDPTAYGLDGAVEVEEDYSKGYPSPSSSRYMASFPARLKAASKFSALPKTYLGQSEPGTRAEITWEDLKVDSIIVDEAHKFKGLFEPRSRGGQVAYLTSGASSTRAWLMEYLTHTVKKRGGQVMLLTATPAKQSPVDFYNIVQLLGARNLGPDQNLYNLFNINTPEEFISRFVCIQERVIVNSNYEARRGIAATMFGPFGNLLSEFTQIFKRYSDRKTVADAPYLRGDTVATSRPNDWSEAQKSKQQKSGGPLLWSEGTWHAEGNVLTAEGPSLEVAFGNGLTRARLRVWSGDDSGDFRIVNYSSSELPNGTFRNEITLLPSFGSPAGREGFDKRPWTVFQNTKVPVPIVNKPIIRMGELQRETYEGYQRALGMMMAEGVNTVRASIGGVTETVVRRTIFQTLSRLALHPELQAYSARFDLGSLDDEEEDEDEGEGAAEEKEEGLKEQKISAAAGQIFSDSILTSYREKIDPDPWVKGAQGQLLQRLQAFTGIDEKGGLDGEGGPWGWNGKGEKLNPEYLDLREAYTLKSQELSDARKEAYELSESIKDSATGTNEEAQAASDKIMREWEAAKTDAATLKGAQVPLPNSEVLGRLRTCLDITLKNDEREAALIGKGKDWTSGVLNNPITGEPFTTKKVRNSDRDNPVKKATVKVKGKDVPDDPEVTKLNANGSRTLAIADTVVGQMLYDASNPYMGSVTCGTIVFVNNLLYQGMQLMTLCRFYALAKAAQHELAAYKKSLKGAEANARTLREILDWYGVGSWECPFTSRSLLAITFPEVALQNLNTGNTFTGNPGDVKKGQSIRLAQNRIHGAAFGSDRQSGAAQGGTYTTPSEDGTYEGSRYSLASEADAPCWEWLQGTRKEPKRWAGYKVKGVVVKSYYYEGWIEMAQKCCLLNAPLSPSEFREELAQSFNGEYEEVKNSRGEPITKCLRPPKFDVVIANQVAYEGIDLQTRTCRIINADLPFTPADLVQRNGRAIRNGNLYEEAEIQAILAMDTVDYYRIQAIERKRGWLDSALDEGKASYELSNDEVELLDLATKAVLPEQREAVRESVAARLDAINSEAREQSLAPIINQLMIASTKQRTININSAADETVYATSIKTNEKAKKSAMRQAAKPSGGCG